MSGLLEKVKFKDCSNWSVSHLIGSQFNYNQDYELVRIGDFLTRNRDRIDIKDTVEYTRVKIKINNNGVFVRDKVMGKDIGTKKQFLIKEGQFLLSKIDARNGAFGLATNEVDNAIITADFFAYEIDKSKIEPYFLVLMTTTKKFKEFAQGASSGTTGRQRIDEKKFLDVKIPLPPLEKQKEIVEAYQSKIDLAVFQESEIVRKNEEIGKYLYEELGIVLDSKTKKSKSLLNVINLKNIGRWDIGYLLDSNSIESKYKLVSIDSVINSFLKNNDGTSLRLESKKYPNDNFKYIGMENIEKETGNIIEIQDVKGQDIKSQTLKLPKGFFLYGKLRPYLNKYYFNQSNDNNIIVSSEFFVFSIKDIDEQYFKVIISSLFIQSQIKNHMKGARMPRIGKDTFLDLKIPLPPLDIQTKIYKYIQIRKDEIKELKEQSVNNRVLALKEFEKEIFDED